ncbi:MAG: glycosyltransferase, partial [Kosmotogaceae bacterium]
MIVCYFGTYRKEYSRNKIMIAALQSAGFEVKECHVSLWHGIEDRVNITIGGWRSPKFWWRAVKAYIKLLWQYQKVGEYDVLMVGYPGQVDVFLARILADLKKKPLVWDVFMSLYLIAIERKLDQKKHSSVKLIRGIEARALRKPDLLIQDTAEYVKWFQQEYGINPERFRLVPTGADDRIFKPLPEAKEGDSLFHVLYYGTFIPNHGVMHIVKAAQLLQDEHQIFFDMIGDGPERKSAEEFVLNNGLENVRFYEWMPQENL